MNCFTDHVSSPTQVAASLTVLRVTGTPFDFGHYRIVEEPLDSDLESDPVIAITRASQIFGLHPDATGLWSEGELAEALDQSSPLR